ncbi:hypothetical protein BGP75_05985 [Motiliproteus sp. MSK22-1]|nr:hypothetical protein BGP75_05985 [Motiliproteus sp. MSK22-1]
MVIIVEFNLFEECKNQRIISEIKQSFRSACLFRRKKAGGKVNCPALAYLISFVQSGSDIKEPLNKSLRPLALEEPVPQTIEGELSPLQLKV